MAKEALENGPDVATVKLDLQTHAGLAKTTQEHERAVDQHDKQPVRTSRPRQPPIWSAASRRNLTGALNRPGSQRAAREPPSTAESRFPRSKPRRLHNARHQTASDAADLATQAARSAEAAVRPPGRPWRTPNRRTRRVRSGLRCSDTAGVLGHVDLLEVGSVCPPACNWCTKTARSRHRCPSPASADRGRSCPSQPSKGREGIRGRQ